MPDTSILNDRELLIIFATAPTGLGHLRVTDALYHGLAETVSPVLLGAQDRSVDTLYRFVTIHPITRSIMEFRQNEPWEDTFTLLTRWYLRAHTKLLYQQLITILNERLTVPKTILIVATHNALAHQLGAIKHKLEENIHAKIFIIVQVTDDSPQSFWYIREADLLCVPSLYTKERLSAYARKYDLPKVPIVVSAYPISPLLTDSLSDAAYTERVRQVSEQSKTTNISIPVSGAAVGTGYTLMLVRLLHKISSRYYFHIVSKNAPYTKDFITDMRKLTYVKMYAADHDRTTVNNYESLFTNTLLALEITKPSEQSFKALCTPKQRGGVILLFSKPIGRQEYDNLHFLSSRGLMPKKTEQIALWEYARLQRINTLPFFQKTAARWRAVCLPDDPTDAANFISWSMKQGFFSTMMDYVSDKNLLELQSDGVKQFWHTASVLLKKNTQPM